MAWAAQTARDLSMRSLARHIAAAPALVPVLLIACRDRMTDTDHCLHESLCQALARAATGLATRDLTDPRRYASLRRREGEEGVWWRCAEAERVLMRDQTAARQLAQEANERQPLLARPYLLLARIADRAIAWLRSLEAGDPFFCWVSFPDPHHPFDPPAAEVRKRAPDFREGRNFREGQVLGAELRFEWCFFWPRCRWRAARRLSVRSPRTSRGCPCGSRRGRRRMRPAAARG